MSSAPKKMNPFPGLRPFTQEEDFLFFGREEQTMELLQRLGNHRFVAVVGTSGSGKSSLVRCGLLSELLGGRMLDAGAAWEVAVTHPGGNPLALLADSLLDADLYDREQEYVRENLLATLSRSHFGLVEAVRQSDLAAGTNFLLVVDQFEEVFRFQDAGQRQKEVANEFVSLLLEAASQKETPIYVVLTMRSDFIGECGQFEGLAEMVNRGEFLIPRLTREQYKRVIEGPVKVAGGKIAPRLLQRLLNDLGQQADQLPCLQHALMRTWNVWVEQGESEELDLADYQRVGRMSQALSLHADEIHDALESDRQRDLCRGVFQALTVEESNNRGIRRPQRLGRLCQILEVSAEELQPIIDAYRHSGVTFLMPSPEVPLTDQTIIDISHESLMRVWTRLRHWVDEEAQAVGIYRRLAESAGLHADGKAGLYRDPELGIALAWQAEKRPNQAWAERYRAGFPLAIEFLAQSQQAHLAEEKSLEAARQRELEQARALADLQQQRAEIEKRTARRLRGLAAIMAVVAVFAVGASAVAFQSWRDADAARQTAQLSERAARGSAENAQREAERATTQESKAKEARRDAEDSLTRARTAIDEFLVQVSDSKLLSTPGLQPLRAELLESAGKFYGEFLTKNPDDPRLKASLADAFYRVGFVNGELGRGEQARTALLKSIELQEATMKNRPTDQDVRHRLAKTYYQLSLVAMDEGANSEADDAVRRAARYWEALSTEYPENLDYLKSLARACNVLGTVSSQFGHLERSFLAYKRSLKIRLDLLERHPQDVEVLHGLSESFNNIGNMVVDLDQRIRLSERSNQYGVLAHRLNPQNVEYANDLAIGYFVMARLQYSKGRKPESMASFRIGVEHCASFIRANPAVPDLREMLQSYLLYLRSGVFDASQADDYAAVFRNVRDLWAQIPRQSTEDYFDWALAQADCAQQLIRARKTFQNRALTPQENYDIATWRAGSLAALKQARSMGAKEEERFRDPLLGDLVNQEDYKLWAASLSSGSANDSQAAPSPNAAVADSAAPVRAVDPRVQIVQDRASGFMAYGVAETWLSQSVLAERSLDEALTLRKSLSDAAPEDVAMLIDVTEIRKLQALLFKNSRRLGEAREVHRRIGQDLEQVLARDLADADAARAFGMLISNEREHANLLIDFGFIDEAAAHLAQALRHDLTRQSRLFKTAPTESSRVETAYEQILAPLLLLLDSEQQGFADESRRHWAKYSANVNGEQAARLARVCALAPGVMSDLTPVLALTEKAQYSWLSYSHSLVLYRLGRYADVIRILENARRSKAIDGMHVDGFLLAMAYFQSGQVEQARILLTQTNAKSPGTMHEWTQHAYNMLVVDWVVLRREANELIFGAQFDWEQRRRRGEGYLHLGEVEKSGAELAAVLTERPDDVRANFLLAQSLQLLSRKEEAAAALERAHRLLDEAGQSTLRDVELWRLASESWRICQRSDEAVVALRRATAAQSLRVLESTADFGENFAARLLLRNVYEDLENALRSAGRENEARALPDELNVFLTANGLPTVVQSISDVFMNGESREAQAEKALAAVDLLLDSKGPLATAADSVSRNLRARLLQRRVVNVREAGRGGDVSQSQAAVRAAFEELLQNDPDNEAVALLLVEVLQESSQSSWTILKPTAVHSEGGATLTVLPDRSILSSGKRPHVDAYTLNFATELTEVAAVRLEALTDPSFPNGGPGRYGTGTFQVSEIELQYGDSEGDQAAAAVFDHAVATKSDGGIANATDKDLTTYWTSYPVVNRPLAAVLRLSEPLKIDRGVELKLKLQFRDRKYQGALLGRFRIAVSDRANHFLQESRRLAAQEFESPWAKLAAAYALVDETKLAAEYFVKACERGDDPVQHASLTQRIVDFASPQAELIKELARRSQQQPLLMIELAKYVSGQDAVKESQSLNVVARSLLDHKIVSEPNNSFVQAALAEVMLEASRPAWKLLTPLEMRSEGGERFTVEPDGSLLVNGPTSDRAIYTLLMKSPLPAATALRLETVPDPRLPKAGAGRSPGNGNFHLAEFKVALPPRTTGESATPWVIAAANADVQYSGDTGPGAMLDGNPETHWDSHPHHQQRHSAVFGLASLEVIATERLQVQIDSGISPYKQHGLGRFRIFVSDDPEALRKESRYLAAKKLASPAAQLGAAYALQSDEAKGVDALIRALAGSPDVAQQIALARQIAASVTLTDELVAEFAKRSETPWPLFYELARALGDQGREAAGAELRARAVAVCESQLAQAPDSEPLQRALAEMLLNSTALEWTPLTPGKMTSQNGSKLQALDDRSVLVSGDVPVHENYEVTLTGLPARFRLLRLEVMPHAALPASGPGRSGGGNFVMTGIQARLESPDPKSTQELTWVRAVADHEQPANPADLASYPIAATLDPTSRTDGWGIYPRGAEPHFAVFALADSVKVEPGSRLTVSLLNEGFEKHSIGRFRLSASDDAAGFERESRRIAALKINAPWGRLITAYALANQPVRVVDLLVAQPARRKELLGALVDVRAPLDAVLDELQRRSPSLYAASLTELASASSNRGVEEMARQIFARLAALHPDQPRWRERSAPWRPGTLAIWNFDEDVESWSQEMNCQLTASEGVLRVKETAADAQFVSSVFTAGANVLALRYRAARAFSMEVYFKDARGHFAHERMLFVPHVDAGDGEWRELELPLDYAPALESLRLDVNQGLGMTVELDSIVLRKVDSTEFRRLVRKVIVEPEIERMTQAIAANPAASEGYKKRGELLVRLGQFHRAAVDFEEELKRSESSRYLNFRIAVCRMLAGDEADYQRHCRAMVEQFRDTRDPEIADTLCKSCLFGPSGIEPSELPTQLLRESAVNDYYRPQRNWFVACCALIAYREGKYEEAIKLEKTFQTAGQTGALALAARAMAEHQLGRTEDAKRSLARLESFLPRGLADLGTTDDPSRLPAPANNVAYDWLVPEILRREAARLILAEAGPPSK